jgi:uncharacterized protein
MSAGAIALYLAVGASAGLLAGLLGVGGGLIIVAALAWVLPGQGVPADHVMHVALATSLASIIATSLSSTRAHARRGGVLWPTVAWLVPGLLIGGLAGAWIADLLSSTVLRYGVAVFCFAAAVQLARGGARGDATRDATPRGAPLSGAGVVIGAIAALVGIGGGSLTVPLLISLGARPVRAVGTSAACGFAIAIASAAGFVTFGHDATGLPRGSWGFVYLPAALALAAASVLSAPLGAKLAHRLRGAHLQLVFAGFLALMGIAVLLSALR